MSKITDLWLRNGINLPMTDEARIQFYQQIVLALVQRGGGATILTEAEFTQEAAGRAFKMRFRVVVDHDQNGAPRPAVEITVYPDETRQ